MTTLTFNRRRWLQSIPLLAAATLHRPWDSAENVVPPSASYKKEESETPFESVTELARDVFFIKGKTSFFENGNVKEVACNNGWIIFNDFVLVIDANLPGNAPELLSQIRKTTSKPIRLVMNTHHHGDHIYGNKYWANQGATLISYTGLLEELKQYETGYYAHTPGRWEDMASKRADVKKSSLFPPQLTFDSKLVIEDKNKRVELLHIGAGHTKGDSVVWLPEEKIMFTGDACLNGPYNNLRDSYIGSWINTLEAMKTFEAKTIVPGHGNLGESITIGNQQHYFQALYTFIKERKQANKTWETIQAQLPLLRQTLEKDAIAKHYLVPEPPVMAMWSLEAHGKRVFEEIS